MKNRAIILLLAVLVLLMSFNLPVSAKTYGDYTYTVTDGEASITGYTGSGGSLTIPSKFGIYAVTAIADNAFVAQNNITAVTIPAGVTIIGDGAFAVTAITSVKFGSGLIKIGAQAFLNCPLTAIAIPDSVTAIGAGAFAGCAELTSVTLGKSLKRVDADAFLCPSLPAVTVPRGVTFIGDHAFGFYAESNEYKKIDFMMRGYTNSAAQSYAVRNGFDFTALGGNFTDVIDGAWYSPYVDDLVTKGIVNGYSNKDNTSFSFKPDKNITRGEFAVILAKASGVNLDHYVWGVNPFTDVAPGIWSSKSILWAYEHGIVNGVVACVYSPDRYITRQDMAVMLSRFAAYDGITLTPTQNLANFADQNTISGYATAAVADLQRAGIITGIVSAGKIYFNPQGYATRAQAAVLVSKLLIMKK